MIKGLYAAASAMLAGLARQQALAHNVANMDTPGFKEVLVSLEDFAETPVVHPPGGDPGRSGLQYLGRLGLGVESSPEETDFTAGGVKFTGETLDLAINGTGFFRVQTGAGERYTRDGRFSRDAAGQLVTVDGYRVLDDGGQPVELPEGAISVQPDGTITVEGEQVSRLGLANFTDPAAELTRDLPNLFVAAGAPSSEELGTLSQGYLEMPNVDPAQMMTQMVSVTRAYEAAQRMVQTQDELLGQTINTLGRL
jgi:flagellar basal-body rod protein FlgF